MPKVDEAAIGAAGIMGGGAFVVGVLGAEAPSASFPQRALFDCVPGLVSTAPEAIGELGLGSISPLTQNSAALQVVLPWLHVGWPLSSENAWDALTMRGGKNYGRRGWGAANEEMLLEASPNGT